MISSVKSLLLVPVMQALGLFLGMGIVSSIPAQPLSGTVPVLAYVTALGSDTVSIIDTATDTVVATVGVGGGPFGIAVSPDGSRTYTANAFDDTVSVIDGSTYSVIATVAIGRRQPLGVAVSPDGKMVYVAIGGSGGGDGGVSVINAATNLVAAFIPLGDGPASAAVSANGKCLYVGTIGSGILIVDTGTNQLTATIPIASGADSIALAPHNPFGYVVNTPGGGDITIFNSASRRASGSVATGGGNVQAVAVSPDSKHLYATDSNLEQVVVFESVSRKIVTRISLPTGSNPIGISLTPDGTKAYVANNGNGTVSVIDTNTNTVRTTVGLAGFPYAKGQFIAPAIPHPAQSAHCME